MYVRMYQYARCIAVIHECLQLINIYIYFSINIYIHRHTHKIRTLPIRTSYIVQLLATRACALQHTYTHVHDTQFPVYVYTRVHTQQRPVYVHE